MIKGIIIQEQEPTPDKPEKIISFMVDEEGEKYIKRLQKEIERLNNIINKAIDFLKENACIDEDVEYFCDDLRYDDCKKLLDILKGGSKECVKKKQDYI